uniref:Uncharacterized protein n=1 Tax=Knipowitschia caucasica TaxID=637954 RepID=A0AAV2JIF1_KNICA
MCYMCQPPQTYGVLKRRHDWSLKLQQFFASDYGHQFVRHSNMSPRNKLHLSQDLRVKIKDEELCSSESRIYLI